MQHNDPRRFPGAWNFARLCRLHTNLPKITHHAPAAVPDKFHQVCHDREHQVALVLQDFDGGAQAQGWRGWRLWQAAWSTLSPSSRTSSCRGCGAAAGYAHTAGRTAALLLGRWRRSAAGRELRLRQGSGDGGCAWTAPGRRSTTSCAGGKMCGLPKTAVKMQRINNCKLEFQYA